MPLYHANNPADRKVDENMWQEKMSVNETIVRSYIVLFPSFIEYNKIA